MIIYHGTTKTAAEAIRREGLKPHRESAYKILVPFSGMTMAEYDEMGLEMAGAEGNEATYFSPSLRAAKRYAIFRTRYELTEEGQLVTAPGLGMFIKTAPATGRKDVPVVVKLDVPDSFAHQNFLTDFGDYEAMLCTCRIGPEHVVDVIELEDNGATKAKQSHRMFVNLQGNFNFEEAR